jgi:type I restriction enzyme R subunit
VALNNDFDQYRIVLEKMADDMIIDRHQANGMLFDAYFAKPEVRAAFLSYLSQTYQDFRDQGRSA